MRILLIGYGKMGKAIEKIAIERGHSIAGAIDADNSGLLQKLTKADVDVAIEFSQPATAFDNIATCIKNGIPVISGTTGWIDRLDEIKSYCEAQNGTFLYASNYSLGVNLFFKLNSFLAKMMTPYNEYNIGMEEIHHTQKLDAPSGTAITLAQDIIKENAAYSTWHEGEYAAQGQLPIKSLRIDQVPGTHSVTYESPIDSIEIKHTAHSRTGFALGAVLVAEWISDKKGVQTMDDFLGFK